MYFFTVCSKAYTVFPVLKPLKCHCCVFIYQLIISNSELWIHLFWPLELRLLNVHNKQTIFILVFSDSSIFCILFFFFIFLLGNAPQLGWDWKSSSGIIPHSTFEYYGACRSLMLKMKYSVKNMYFWFMERNESIPLFAHKYLVWGFFQ